MRALFLILISAIFISPAIAEDKATTPSAEFQGLLTVHWERAQKEQVFFRTDPDAFRPNGKLPEFSATARARRKNFNAQMLKELSEINRDNLSRDEQISFDLFHYERETEAQHYEMPDHLFPITSLFGYHTYFANAPYNMAFDTQADYESYLTSLADFPRYNNEHIQLLREAAQSGYTHYCGSIDTIAPSIKNLIVDDPKHSDLYAPFTRFPAGISEKNRKSLAKRGEALVKEAVLPSYRELDIVFTQIYLPKCRKNVGITSLEGGEDYYQYLLHYFTTTDMTPREIHDLGLSEVTRIRAEMDGIINAVGFDGSFKQFLSFLRTDPQFFAVDGQDLLEKTAFITKKMDGQMPRLFGRLARNTYEIRGVSGRGAYYVAAKDPRTPGVYFISTGDLKSQPLYNLEALSLHEAVPGHHHQSALALELDVPEFRKTLYHAAYGEGWGLYSESLGKEVGFYTDPYSDFGRLTYEMWRACRLVVDTGMHAFGWSRQQAIDYLLDNTALTQGEVTSEIDRYITWPGQATAYKIGELRIKAMRVRAQAELGNKFDLRAFHDVLVGNGSLPIAVVDSLIDQWIDENR